MDLCSNLHSTEATASRVCSLAPGRGLSLAEMTGEFASHVNAIPVYLISTKLPSDAGRIPTEIGALEKLQQLDISSNKLTGSFPKILGCQTVNECTNPDEFDYAQVEFPRSWAISRQ